MNEKVLVAPFSVEIELEIGAMTGRNGS